LFLDSSNHPVVYIADNQTCAFFFLTCRDLNTLIRRSLNVYLAGLRASLFLFRLGEAGVIVRPCSFGFYDSTRRREFSFLLRPYPQGPPRGDPDPDSPASASPPLVLKNTGRFSGRDLACQAPRTLNCRIELFFVP